MKKHITLTGCSNTSWKDAIIKVIEDASKTIHNLETVTVIKQIANIKDNKIVEYFAIVEITFSIDENIRNEKQETNNQ